MLFPKKVKFRKWQKKRTDMSSRVETRGTELSFGSFGIKSEALGRITSNQIEAARKAASRHLTKVGRMWIRVLPGRILFEVDGVPEAVAKEALRKAGTKLPIKTRVISRD